MVDYGMGNVWSVISALRYLGAEAELVADPDIVGKSGVIVLPGVGSFRKAMEILRARGIHEAITDAVYAQGSKILGICLGMQLMGSHGTEDGDTVGLGLLPHRVECFTPDELGNKKIPHIGFNSVCFSEKSGLFRDIPELSDFYFVHSYRMLVGNFQGRYATCSYGVEFLASFQVDRICGTQFHPEKSQTNGLILLRNFLEL